MNRNLALVIAAATALAVLATASLATADDGSIPDCPPAEEQEFSQESGHVDEHYHLNLVDENASKLGLWRELNRWPGLQTEPGSCDYWGDIRTYPADIHVDSPSETGID